MEKGRTFTIHSADFITGADCFAALPRTGLPEIAMTGRSNSGKSTFINLITGRKKLARMSSRPGKTREINLFKIELSCAGREHEIVIADLPGFGFAKFSKEEREKVSRETVRYLQEREALSLVCLLNDCRRNPEADELAIMKVCRQRSLDFRPVVSKVDKLSKRDALLRSEEIADAYGIKREHLMLSPADSITSRFWELSLLSVGG